MNFQVLSTDSKEGGILFLAKAVICEVKKKNESKRKQRVPEFFHIQEEKIQFNNLTRNKTSR